ncbi:uncharacterized protein PY1_contig-04-216 [Novosphingobium sp. PY1]|nr:uncharacterized protein PY1_contig-04-216 [Novosphingobium sp. PY1]
MAAFGAVESATPFMQGMVRPMQFHGQAIGDPGEERGIVRTFTIEPFAFPPQAAALREQVRAIVADPLA